MNMPNRPPPPFFTTLPEQQRKEIYAEWVTWNETAREPLSLDAFAQMKSDPNAAAQNPRYPTSPGPDDVIDLQRDVLVDVCVHGHKFTRLESHPMKDGMARCPYCMAIGYDALKAQVGR